MLYTRPYVSLEDLKKRYPHKFTHPAAFAGEVFYGRILRSKTVLSPLIKYAHREKDPSDPNHDMVFVKERDYVALHNNPPET